LRSDPFEKANLASGEYERRYVEHMFVMAPAQAIVAGGVYVHRLSTAPEISAFRSATRLIS